MCLLIQVGTQAINFQGIYRLLIFTKCTMKRFEWTLISGNLNKLDIIRFKINPAILVQNKRRVICKVKDKILFSKQTLIHQLKIIYQTIKARWKELIQSIKINLEVILLEANKNNIRMLHRENNFK